MAYTFTRVIDREDVVRASHINDLQIAVEAISASFDAIPNSPLGLHTILPALCAASVVTQNVTYLKIMDPLFIAKTVTNANIRNGATSNGNVAISVWVSNDGGVTFTRLGGAAVAQGSVNVVQAISLGSIVIPKLKLWGISFSSNSATGTYNTKGTFSGTEGSHLRVIGSYNATADQTWASLGNTAGVIPWVELT